MFGNKKISKIQKEICNDPQKAIEHAQKSLNTGLTGFASKAFLGKDFMNNVNDMLAKGQMPSICKNPHKTLRKPEFRQRRK